MRRKNSEALNQAAPFISAIAAVLSAAAAVFVLLREEIEKLSARYPTYGYRRITQLLKRLGYTVGSTRVARFGIDISLAHRGRPWDNGYAERFIRTLKEKEVYLNEYDDMSDARARIEHFILQVYNHKRPHSALGYLTPVEFDTQLLV